MVMRVNLKSITESEKADSLAKSVQTIKGLIKNNNKKKALHTIVALENVVFHGIPQVWVGNFIW